MLGSRSGLVRMSTPVVSACVRQVIGRGWGCTWSEDQLTALMLDHQAGDPHALIRFMMDVGVLRGVAQPWPRYKALRIIDSPASTAGEVGLLHEELPFFTGLPAVDRQASGPVQPDEFVVLHLRTYDGDLIDRLQRQVREAGTAAMVTSYYLGRTHLIDGLYAPAAVTPCHFCQQPEGRPAALHGHQRIPTWKQALDAVRLPPGAVSGLEYPLRSADYLLGQVLLRNRINELLAPQLRPLPASACLEAVQTSLDDLTAQRGVPYVNLECDRCTPH